MTSNKIKIKKIYNVFRIIMKKTFYPEIKKDFFIRIIIRLNFHFTNFIIFKY